MRIAAPPGTAHELLVPFACRLKKTLPDVRLHLISGVQQLDLSRGHAELAVRSFRPTQPDLAVVLTGRVELGVFASKAYAARVKGPVTLAEVDWIAWAYPNEHVEPNPTLQRLVPEFEPAFASNDYIVQVRAVAEGLGAMVLPRTYFAGQPYERFVELDVGMRLGAIEFYLVCAKAMRFTPRVHAVIRELGDALRSVEGLEIVEDRTR